MMQTTETRGRTLPDGVWYDEVTRRYMHNRLVHTGFYDKGGRRLFTPDEVAEVRRKGGEVFEDHDRVPVECRIPSMLDDETVDRERKASRLAETDFYHPVHGLLVGGRKRAVEAPENRGTNSILRQRQRTAVALDPALAPIAPEIDESAQDATAPESARGKRGA